ncbi:MAG: tetratricopeptide repeat protein [Kofleriaceae bacterium]
MPPPIPGRRSGPTLPPSGPTVVDRALATPALANHTARARLLAKEHEEAAKSDPVAAAASAYELGELCERSLGDEDRALRMYRRALELDPLHLANRWALRRILYRRKLWPQLAQLIDRELALPADPAQRVDLLLEQALVHGRDGSDERARKALDQATQLAPAHHGVLLELERIAIRARDTPAMIETWERLADAVGQPERAIAYRLAVARAANTDPARANRALDDAARLAASLAPPARELVAERLARERVRVAEDHGTPAQLGAAVDAFARALATTIAALPGGRARALEGELVAVYRRQAQLAHGQPADAKQHLEHARVLAPREPVIWIDLVEHATAHHPDDVPELVRGWHGFDDDAGRSRMLSLWSADARGSDRQPLLAALATVAPGYLPITANAECVALGQRRIRANDLATTYLASAEAAAAGTWFGTRSDPEPAAATALYVQAAELLAYHVGTPAALDQARAALTAALAAAPGDSATLEAMTELDEVTGRAGEAIIRLRADRDPITLVRGIRLARTHGLMPSVLELQRDLFMLEPSNLVLAWQLESTLYQLGRSDERAELLIRLARHDTDPARRRTALFDAARLYQRLDKPRDATTTLFRELATAWPQGSYARTVTNDLLRAQERWEDLVTERLGEARTAIDPATARRALREAAWVLEVRIANLAGAATVYDEWLQRLPGDRTALEGIARCRAALGEYVLEEAARAAIVELDNSEDARFLHARSLERAGRLEAAAEVYQRMIESDDPGVATTTAILALGDLAALGNDVELRVDSAMALADRTTDESLGGSLREESGWLHALALDDRDASARAFASALTLQPTRTGGLLGAALVAAAQSEPERLAKMYADLAAAVAMPVVSGALLLRASAIATVTGDRELASSLIEQAQAATPADDYTVCVVAEAGPSVKVDPRDPFGTVERLNARADLLAQRAALTDDPVARLAWELDRADLFEQAGQLREAVASITAVLGVRPDDRRAMLALRRIAQQVGDKPSRAQASYQLARSSRDPAFRVKLLREAAEVFDRTGPTHDVDHALAIYRQIIAIDPDAPERERMLELLRERGASRGLIATLSERLEWLAESAGDETEMTRLLLERATVLNSLGERDEATSDLDALLEHDPAARDALRLRAELATVAGDVPEATSLLWRYLAVETDATRRAAAEAQIARLETDDLAPPPPPASRRRSWTEEQTTGVQVTESVTKEVWEEHTDAESLKTSTLQLADLPIPRSKETSTPPATRISAAIIRRTDSMATQLPKDVDPFGGNTVRVDVSMLQERERSEIKHATDEASQTLEQTVIAPQPEPAPRTATHTVRRDSKSQPVMSVNAAMAVAVGAGMPDETKSRQPARLNPPRRAPSTLAELDVGREPARDVTAIQFPVEAELSGDDSAVVMLSYAQLMPAKVDDSSKEMLEQCEAELAMADDSTGPIELRIEAGRLAELAGEAERARTHYEAAVIAEPRALAALRGLRRLARGASDLREATQLVDAELALVGPRERAALQRYRIDLLLATQEHDVARVAVGALLDAVPLDPAGLLAHLELAFLDGRADELGRTLDQLASVLTDGELIAALGSARAALAIERGAEIVAYANAAEAAPATRLAQIRQAAMRGQVDAVTTALFDLACDLEGNDPVVATALAVRVQRWAASSASGAAETVAAASQLASRTSPRDPIVARLAVETELAGEGGHEVAIHALTRWARSKAPAAERAYAAARAAELDPARLGRLWAQVLSLDPDDDYAAAHLERAHVEAGDADLAVELELRRADETQQDARLVSAALQLADQDDVDVAIDALVAARALRPDSVVLVEMLAELLARVGRWHERAVVLTELADSPGQYAGDIARVRSALAWEAAVTRSNADTDVAPAIAAALAAIAKVLDDQPHEPVAHAAAIALAERTRDPSVLAGVLGRARAAERSPWAAASLALRQARITLDHDAAAARELARAAGVPGDPRRTLAMIIGAAHAGDLVDAATALEHQAELVATVGERAALRLRAAYFALAADAPSHARRLLLEVESAVPGVVVDLLDTFEPTTIATQARASFSRALRDAERADGPRALELYQRALVLRPGEPLASMPLVQLAAKLRDPDALTAVALEQLRTAEARGDTVAKAEAFELIARVDEVLRGDLERAQVALESALRADPSRMDLIYRIEHHLIANDRHDKLLAMRDRELGLVEANAPLADLAALVADTALLALRHDRPDPEVAKRLRQTTKLDPRHRLAWFQLESVVRRSSPDDRAGLEEAIAAYFDDPRARAAFLTRAGETVAAAGRFADAAQRFARAIDACPEYAPALDAWQQVALDGALWTELPTITAHRARLGGDPGAIAAAYHFAGVALADKAQRPELAIAEFQRALALDPNHHDTFVRLRGLFEATWRTADLATLLRDRLAIETDPAAQVELHRVLGEHSSLADRKVALQHFRTILTINPADARAHAAIADLASQQGSWEEAADAIHARMPLERDPRTLKLLHQRLGVIYADHEPRKALEAFQQALALRPGDVEVLARISELAIAAGEWKLALDTCEQLVAAERNPAAQAAHLARAATIVARGFDDRPRAAQLLDRAFDTTPTDACLQAIVELNRAEPAVLDPRVTRIADAMRVRIAANPLDGDAYRLLSRAAAAHSGGKPAGHAAVARVAAELAVALDAGDDAERGLLAVPISGDLAAVGPRADEILFSQAPALLELRRVLRLVGEPIAKLFGRELAAHGAMHKRDQLRAQDPAAVIVREVATAVGLKAVDVYVSNRHSHAMIIEVDPLALVLGEAIVSGDPIGVRFAAGATLALARLSLAVPARLAIDELSILVLAVLRLFRPIPAPPDLVLDPNQIASRSAALRRAMTPALVEDTRPHALAIESFDPHALARDIKTAGLRAGLIASGSLRAGLAIIAGIIGTDLRSALADPMARGLIAFALDPATWRTG